MTRRRLLPALTLAALALPSPALAQAPAEPAPAPAPAAPPQQSAFPQDSPPLQQVYPPQQGTFPQDSPPPQPGYPPPQEPPGESFPPGTAPLVVPVAVPVEECCRWSVRFDPFELVYRRLAFDAEVKITGSLSIGMEPAWIWGSGTDNVDEQGFQLLTYVGWTFSGATLRGFWVRAVGGFEAFDATLTHPRFSTVKTTKGIASGIFGAMVGNSVVFGRNGGFTLSGGIGVGVATAETTEVVALSPNPDVESVRVVYYDGASRVKLLGSLGLGITF